MPTDFVSMCCLIWMALLFTFSAAVWVLDLRAKRAARRRAQRGTSIRYHGANPTSSWATERRRALANGRRR